MSEVPQLPNINTLKKAAYSLQERFTRTDKATLESAKETASKRLQGAELMQVVSAKWTAEKAAAASADQFGKESKSEGDTSKKKVLAEAMVMGKALVQGAEARFSEEELQILGAEGGDWKTSILKGIELKRQKQEQLRLLAEARGALPKESLAKEQLSVQGIETAEAHEVLAGKRLVELLKTDGTFDDLDALAKGVAMSETMERARVSGEHHLSNLRDRLKLRYPSDAVQIDEKYDALLGEQKTKRDETTLHTEISEISSENVANAVKDLLEKAKIQRPENQVALLEGLGVFKHEDGKYFFGETSPLRHAMETKALGKDQTADLEAIMQRAEDEPKLADQALTIALTRYSTNQINHLIELQVEETVQAHRIQEALQISEEKAKAESAANWLSIKSFANKLSSNISKVANKVAGKSAQTLGKTVKIFGQIAAMPGILLSKGGDSLASLAERTQATIENKIVNKQSAKEQSATKRAAELAEQIKKLEVELAAINSTK